MVTAARTTGKTSKCSQSHSVLPFKPVQVQLKAYPPIASATRTSAAATSAAVQGFMLRGPYFSILRSMMPPDFLSVAVYRTKVECLFAKNLERDERLKVFVAQLKNR